jgi:hypothetical protein
MRSSFAVFILASVVLAHDHHAYSGFAKRHTVDNLHPLDFTIPSSQNTVKVHMLKALDAVLPTSLFIAADPKVPTQPDTDLIGSAYYIEHSSGRRVLFDVGIRNDTQNLAPAAIKAFSRPDGTFPFVAKKDVPTQLEEGGIDLKTIDTVFWRWDLSDLLVCGWS